jgi:hypothetical protein
MIVHNHGKEWNLAYQVPVNNRLVTQSHEQSNSHSRLERHSVPAGKAITESTQPAESPGPRSRCLSVRIAQQLTLALKKQQFRQHQPAAHGAVGCPTQPGQASTDAPNYTLQATQDSVTHQLCSHVFCTVWDYVDAGVAYVFGLDESKYQWAIDRHNQLLAQVRYLRF